MFVTRRTEHIGEQQIVPGMILAKQIKERAASASLHLNERED